MSALIMIPASGSVPAAEAASSRLKRQDGAVTTQRTVSILARPMIDADMASRLPVIVLALCLAACTKGESAPVLASAPLQRPTTIVQQETLPTLYRAPGTVVSDDRIDLSSRLVGRIAHLEVREGQSVAKGDLLLRIDPTEVDDAIRQAQATVAAARNDLGDAEQDLDKYGRLAPKGYVSTETLRKARVRRDSARATLEKAESALAAATAQRSYADIRSPVDGVLVARHGHVGELAVPGTAILTLESRRALVLRVFVAEAQVGLMAPGLGVSVRIDALPEREVAGQVRRIVPSGDPLTRRYQVDIALPSVADAQAAVLPGMFGRAEFVLGEAPALLVSRQALVSRGGLGGVFVVDEANQARFRWLRLGREWGDRVEVVAGLSARERILTRADELVRDGEVIAGVPHD